MVAATTQATLVPQPSVSGSGSGSNPDLPCEAQRQARPAEADEGVAVPLQEAAGISAPLAPAAFAAIQAKAPGDAADAAAAGASADACRAAGGAGSRDPLSSPHFRNLLAMIRGSSQEFEAQGRVLRLRQYLRSDVKPQVGGSASVPPEALRCRAGRCLPPGCCQVPSSPRPAGAAQRPPPAAAFKRPVADATATQVLDAVLEALEANTRVEALYCQNFEQVRLQASASGQPAAACAPPRDRETFLRRLLCCCAAAPCPKPRAASQPPSWLPSRHLFAARPCLQGMLDAQLDRLARLLRRRRIWAVNVGENFGTTQAVSVRCFARSARALLQKGPMPGRSLRPRVPHLGCLRRKTCMHCHPSTRNYATMHMSAQTKHAVLVTWLPPVPNPPHRPGTASARRCRTPRWATCL